MDVVEKWTEDRDSLLIEWFADGLTNEEVLLQSQERGLDLSLEGVNDRRAFLRRRILEQIASRGARILDRIPRASKAVRVREIDELCETLRRGLIWCEDHEKWTTLGRLADVALRAHRLLAEEVNDIEPAARGINIYLQFVQQAPPEKREQVVRKLQEIRTLIDAGQQLALAAEATGTGLPVIDVEAEAVDEEG